MNAKISGQSTKTNYKNTGSSAGAVKYDAHDFNEFLDEALDLGASKKQMQFYDMDGHVVEGAEVIDKIDRHHSGLHKDDAKFYCIMLDPSDSEIAAMGAGLTERLTNGQQYVFDVMDAYARIFNREGVEDRHNLTAFAIPHLYKGENKKEQLHWHIIVARKDASNRFKLSPLTNHRGTTKGAVKGGFDRVAFDAECERLFDVRFGYERKVGETFEYCLAQKKGTPEQKAEQTQRLAEQDRPDLEAAVNAFVNHRVAQLAAEATARVIAEQKAKEEAARLEAARIERAKKNSYWNSYNTYYKPLISQVKEACSDAFSMYRDAKERYGETSKLISDKYVQLRAVYKQINNYEDDVRDASTSRDLSVTAAILIGILNPVAGLIIGLVGGIIAESNRIDAADAKRDLRAQAQKIRDDIENLKNSQVKLRQEKEDTLQAYVESKDVKSELVKEMNALRDELLKPVEAPESKEQRTIQGFLEGYAKHVAEKKKTASNEARLVAESLSGKFAAYRRKSEILEIFRVSEDATSLSLNLASHGLSIREKTSNRGVEDISITAGGETPFTVEASSFGQEYLHQLLTMYEVATKRKPAFKTEQELQNAQRLRQEREAARKAMEINAAQEAAKKEARRMAEQNKFQNTNNNNHSTRLKR